ncbi:MAG: ISAs1 family transposase [Proteobacteria bacterium]|nr:ISAs1 family transposase [Pseudomonadota bacterium]
MTHEQQDDLRFSEETISSFIEILDRTLPDHRDNRGKRHNMAFAITCFLLATLSGRHKISSIHRFISNKLDWLRNITGMKEATIISRAHLPRLLNGLDWVALDALICRVFDVKIDHSAPKKWVAIDGKALRGSQYEDDKQSVVFAVDHATRETLAQARQVGAKSSEINVVRTLLAKTGLDSQKISLDAHHCNPETTRQIHQATGIYLVQVKENQAVLLQQCQTWSANLVAVTSTLEHDKANGRISSRYGQVFNIAQESAAPRWQSCQLSTLVVITRETYHIGKEKSTLETSHYVSNQVVREGDAGLSKELIQAVQKHWGVESNNWIRDVTFGEDLIKVKSGHQGQIMARLRSIAVELIRKTGVKNFQAAIEGYIDSPSSLELMLRQVGFL